MGTGQHYSDGNATPRYEMSVFKTSKPHRSGTCLLLVMVVAACVGPLLVYRYWDITAATAASQQEVSTSIVLRTALQRPCVIWADTLPKWA